MTPRAGCWASSVRLLGYAAVLLLLARASSAKVPPEAVVLSTGDVYAYDKADPYDLGNLYGFNHAPSVTLLPDGRLLTAWFSGPYEASVHQVILGSYSSDQGQTWTDAEVLQDDPHRSDFDPAFIANEDRTWLFFTVGRWNRYPFVGLRDAEKREVGIDSFKLFSRTFEGSNEAWSEPRQVMETAGWGCRSNGIILSSGELLLPIYDFHPPYTSAVLISSDDGESWERFGRVQPPDNVGAAEPTVAELPSGRLIMALRTTDGHLWTSVSSDRGKNWSAPVMSDMIAAQTSHNLFCTSKGVLVLTHNASRPPLRTPLTLRTSLDEGRTWSDPIVLDEVESADEKDVFWSRQVTYPSVIELSDGTLAIVWAKLEISNRRQSGVIRCARVKLE